MPSLSSTLEKLHLRRKSQSSSPSSPTRSGAGGRNDGSGSPGNGAGSPRVPTSPYRDAPPHEAPDRRSSLTELAARPLGGGGPVPPVPASPQTKSLPRSPGKFALPPIPATPVDEQPRVGPFTGGSAARSPQSGTSAKGPPRLPDIEPVGGFDDNDMAQRSRQEWTEADPSSVLVKQHELSEPRTLFPMALPTFPYDEETAKTVDILPEGYRPIPFVRHRQYNAVSSPRQRQIPVLSVNPAFVGDHFYSYGFRRHREGSSSVDDEFHQRHLQKHLRLLSPTIFTATAHGRPARFQDRHDLRNGKARRVEALRAGPVVPYYQAESELERQREALISSIVSGDRFPRGHASAALLRDGDRKLQVDEVKKVVFDSVGWTERLGILDTIDVHTTYLEPVIQEHVQPIEHVIYTTLITREIHRYHIYPFIQPIADPSPKVLPTRHLFPDPTLPTIDGKTSFRVIYGDAAAEAVLGRPLTAAERTPTYHERWIEGVDGVEYERMERASVEVGKRGWVERVGARMDGRAEDWFARLAEREGRGGARVVPVSDSTPEPVSEAAVARNAGAALPHLATEQPVNEAAVVDENRQRRDRPVVRESEADGAPKTSLLDVLRDDKAAKAHESARGDTLAQNPPHAGEVIHGRAI